jgi:hypothetical protein
MSGADGLPLEPSGAAAVGQLQRVDDTAESVPDTAATLAQEISRRAEVIMLAHQSLQQDQQAKLDRMRADFNATQEERAEMLREMNALRDMAMEQSKKDDEILKKFIAMI